MSLYKHSLLLIVTVIGHLISFAQTAPGKYWIQFTNKDNTGYSLSDPSQFLSPKTIDKRLRFQLGFDYRDLPVNVSYIEAVKSLCDCNVHNTSKWFNAISIQTDNSDVLPLIASLDFVSEVRSVRTMINESFDEESKFLIEQHDRGGSDQIITQHEFESSYGPSYSQINTINGLSLHALGLKGEGISIAVFDAGWSMVDKLPAFDYLISHGGIVETRDFVAPQNHDVYNLSTHGMFVLSIMAGVIADSLYGTAPDADYYLFRTEDPLSEYLVEEDNWVSAAEYADSIGIDIINSSLGYSLFQDETQNHSYADMDGNTTRISIAADIAASKGIFVVNSAGNSGASDWRYITAPSDGDSVLCVGAISADSLRASFSSFGPSFDGDVKPNVCAIGFETVIADLDSTIRVGNGTSFSAPVIAGMTACLMQAYKSRKPMELFRAIEQSAHLYRNPDDGLGYGVPDFWKAFTILQGNTAWTEDGLPEVLLFPNPCTDHLKVIISDERASTVHYEIYDPAGRRIVDGSGALQSNETGFLLLSDSIRNLAVGFYHLHLKIGHDHTVIKFSKI